MTTARASQYAGVLLLITAGSGCAHTPAPRSASSSTIEPEPTPLARAAKPQAVLPAPETGYARNGDSIYFDFDAYILREDARPELQKLSEHLKQHPTIKVRIEGNCDERGTTEYNLALGEQRARAAKEYLTRLGIDADRIQITTYGSERPHAIGHDEQSWAKNRRDDVVVQN